MQAREWVDATVRRRPQRPRFFADFCATLSRIPGELAILELGSGPGHLAREILTRCRVREYVALDFSEPMHAIARAHLGELAARVTFATRDFRSRTWPAGFADLDAVVMMQAAHETRHKRHLVPLLRQAREILRLGGSLLYSDHYAADGMNRSLHLERAEQPVALREAGFAHVELIRDEGGIAMYAAHDLGYAP